MISAGRAGTAGSTDTTASPGREHLVEPVEDLLVEPGAVPGLAVAGRSLVSREADQFLGAAQRVVQLLGLRRKRVVLGAGDQGGAGDGGRRFREVVVAHLHEV